MPGRGPVPKPTRIRDRDNVRRLAEFTRLTPDGAVRGPELPDVITWPEQTVALYEALRRDPVAQVLSDADFLHVVDTMLLHAEMWSGSPGAFKLAAEIRLRLGQLGVTPEARMRMRLLIESGDDAAAPSKLDDLRARQNARIDPARMRRILREVDKGNQV